MVGTGLGRAEDDGPADAPDEAGASAQPAAIATRAMTTNVDRSVQDESVERGIEASFLGTFIQPSSRRA
jgi:hypothetical protein